MGLSKDVKLMLGSSERCGDLVCGSGLWFEGIVLEAVSDVRVWARGCPWRPSQSHGSCSV